TWLSGDYHDRTSTGKLIQTFKTHHSRYGLHARRVAYATLYTEGSSSFVTSTAASVATGWSEPVPGRDFHPLWTSAFSRRTEELRLAIPTIRFRSSAGIRGRPRGFDFHFQNSRKPFRCHRIKVSGLTLVRTS